MSKKNSKKHLQKRKLREKEVKKRIMENRVILRRERRDERIREQAFEKEFAKKSEECLSNEERKERLEHNLKILEALEKEYDKENNITDDKAEKLNKQFETTEEFKKLQVELYEILDQKQKDFKAGDLTPEKEAQYKAKIDDIAQKIEQLKKTREENTV